MGAHVAIVEACTEVEDEIQCVRESKKFAMQEVEYESESIIAFITSKNGRPAEPQRIHSIGDL